MSTDQVFRARRTRDGGMRIVYRYSLRDLYAELNERFWAGRLPPTLSTPMIFPEPPRLVMVRRVSCGVVSDKSPWRSVRRGLRGNGQGCYAVGTFSPPEQHWPALIRIASPLGDAAERRVLLHEMIHCGVWFDGFVGERHGPRFVAELERLAAAGESWAADQAIYYREHPE